MTFKPYIQKKAYLHLWVVQSQRETVGVRVSGRVCVGLGGWHGQDLKGGAVQVDYTVTDEESTLL